MSNYWQNKMTELEKEKKKKKKQESSNNTSNYWKDKMTELESEQKKKQETSVDIAPVKSNRTKSSQHKTTQVSRTAQNALYSQENNSTSYAPGYQLLKQEEDRKKRTSDWIRTMGAAAKEHPELVKKEEEQEWYEWLGEKLLDKLPPVYLYNKVSSVVDAFKDNGEGEWLKTPGAFKDGYDFGDVTKTILGVGNDISENAFTGVIDMGESLIDDVAQGYGYLASLWDDNAKSDAKEFIAKDLLHSKELGEDMANFFNYVTPNGLLTKAVGIEDGKDTEKYSVLGDKSDSLVQSGAQMAAGVALQAAGVPYELTTGLTAFGSGLEDAYANGATFDEATLSAAANAALEIATEKLFKGSVYGEKGLIDTSKITQKIANKTLKTLAGYGVDLGAEGIEEVVAEFGGNLATLIYEDNKDILDVIASEEAWQGYADAAIGGMVLGGLGNVPKVTNSIKNKTDYNTGLTADEQTVFDKELERRIAEAESKGKLTKSQKDKIAESVLTDMEKGYITTDRIEEILGGEEYTTYKTDYDKAVESEDAIVKEFDELADTPSGQLSYNQQQRFEELKAQIEDARNKTKSNELKSQFDNSFTERIKNSRLTESYREKARRGQYFEADVSQYKNEAAKQTIQNILDGKAMNNTRPAHDMADLLVKVAERTGKPISVQTAQQIAEAGYGVEGATVNGYVNEQGNITLNIEAAKALNSVVGHEVTHILEQTEHYSALQEIAFKYAQTKGEYQSRYDALAELYKGKKGYETDFDNKVKKELAADLVGDYLFTDEHFIENLAAKNRNVFQKIYDEIKYLVKVATAGSEEARQLAQVERNFKRAWDKANTKASGEVQNSLSDSDYGDRSMFEVIDGYKPRQTNNEGKGLTDGQMNYFKDSKMRDDNGNLMVMYHGSQDAGFHTFDGKFSDDGASFFFVDRNDVAASYSGTSEVYEARTFNTAEDMNNFLVEIGRSEYKVAEKDGEYTLYDDGGEVATSKSLAEIYEEFCEWEGVGYGSANYKVYLNLTNPMEVDAEGRNWNRISGEFSQEVYDRFQTLTDAEKSALHDLAGWEDAAIFRDELKTAVESVERGADYVDDFTRNLASAAEKLGDADKYRLFDIATDNFTEETLRENAVRYLNTRDYAQRAKEQGYDGVIFKNIHDNGGYSNGSEGASTVAVAFNSNQIKSTANANPTKDADIRYSLSDSDGTPIDSARISHNEMDNQYSLSYNAEIANGQNNYLINHKANVDAEELAEAHRVTAAMVDVMMKYSSILPEDKIGKVLTKNGSYDRSVENTTICVRTLAYNEFVDKVQEEIGRPLTQMESFLVSQKMYDIATDPQCLYCYVSLDRKAFNDMLLRYMQDRDTVIAKYNNSDKTDATIENLYEEFLHGRKPTKEMRRRFDSWISYVDNGTQLLSLADIATEERQSTIASDNDSVLAEQLKDARKYAQSASWSKIQKDYVAYRDEILRLGDKVVKNLNEHYGMRWYSFSDYSAAFIVENMQQITDASIRGLKGLSYTKDTDYAEIFAPSGMNINISVFVNTDADGNFFIDEKQSANLEKALALREQYPNVGIVATVTNDEALRWAGEQEWTDVIIPFHIVRTGTDVAEYYKWLNYTAESADTIGDKDMWNAYLDSLNLSDNARKRVSKNIYPSEHMNDRATYLNLCESRGLTPRFARFAGEDWYMKLVNETRLSANDSSVLKPSYNLEAAKASFAKFVEKGGYEGGWYKDGVDVDAEARAVAEDVLAGKKANEVDYGRQDGFAPESLIAGRKTNRQHGRNSLSPIDETAPTYGNYNIYGKDIAFAPVQDSVQPSVQEQKAVSQKAVDNTDFAPANFDDVNATAEKAFAQITDEDAPPETEAPYSGESNPERANDPFADRPWWNVDRKAKAFTYENPDARPFFAEEAMVMLGDLSDTQRGERLYNDDLYYETNGEQGFLGIKRHTSDEIAQLLDDYGLSYAEIETGLEAIIEGNSKLNNKAAKHIESIINDRLLNGYKDWHTGEYVPPNQRYIEWLNGQQIDEEYREAANALTDADAPMVEDFAPVAPDTLTVEDVMPIAEVANITAPIANNAVEQTAVAEDQFEEAAPQGGRQKQRKWVGTSTESEAVNREILPDDLDQNAIHYTPIPNKVTLGNANSRLDSMGYDMALTYFNSQMAGKKVTLDDIALGERLIQEAIKRGDKKTAGELIQNVSILGTELGQKVQALSIIKKLTPEGQLKMLQKVVERGKAKGDKAYDGVEVTQDMVDNILDAYDKDGSYDQDKLNAAIEDAKQKLADQMGVSVMDKVNAWRYLSMLGNPKTHIRNFFSNVAMKGTMAVKNVIARTVEDIAPIKDRTKTWKRASDDVKAFADKTVIEMQDVLQDGGKYSEDASIKAKRKIFKSKLFGWLNWPSGTNSNMLSKEDWWFSKPAFKNALQEYLTANDIRTEQDILLNPETVEKARQYATEQSQIATFRQYSWLANKIGEIEQKNAATQIAVGAILPFKKTPINIAKTGLNYSPLGFAKTLTYDIAQVKKGNMEASTLVDHLAQNITGTGLALFGYMLASMGVISGGGEDDKEAKYDYQLGEQSYAVNIGGKSYSLSWLSPVAMPLFVGANAYETLVEKEKWDGDVVVQTLAETLDPLSEMSFLSGLDSVLSSYESGVGKFIGIGEAMAQNYTTQFIPTLSSQFATVLDDTKRSTKASKDSDWRAGEETWNKIKFKIPGLRNTLEPSTDIWGNEIKQTEDKAQLALETFIAPYAVRENTATAVDEEIKGLYRETGDTGLLPSVPYNYIDYKNTKYDMSAEDFTAYKKTYGQTAYNTLAELFDTSVYRNADANEKAELVNMVYDYARDEAKRGYLLKQGVQYTNATEEDVPIYRENAIKGAIKYNVTPDEYNFIREYPEKYNFFQSNGISYEDYKNADEDGKRAYTWAYENPSKVPMAKAVAGDIVQYRKYTSNLYDIRADKDEYGESISGSAKAKKWEYIFNLDLDYGQQAILYRSMYSSKDDKAAFDSDIFYYLESRSDISWEDEKAILEELGFTVYDDGTVEW